MKTVTARATYSERAKKLFGSDSAMEAVRGILKLRDDRSGQFVVRGETVRTTVREADPFPKKARR